MQVSVSAERDPDRVLWATESFAADVEERTHSPFKQMYSFNTDDMLRDQRFRVCLTYFHHRDIYSWCALALTVCSHCLCTAVFLRAR